MKEKFIKDLQQRIISMAHVGKFLWLMLGLSTLLQLGITTFAEAQRKIYWANRGAGTIGRMNVDGTDIQTNWVSVGGNPYFVALDQINGKIYWANEGGSSIGIMNTDGTGANSALITGQAGIYGLVVDPHNGKIYFNSGANLRSANLDGSGVTTIATIPGLSYGLDLDYYDQRLFYGTYATIGTINTNGTGRTTIITGRGSVNQIALDRINRRIYWVEFSASAPINRANYDGSSISGLHNPGYAQNTGITVDATANWIYWSSNSNAIGRMTLGLSSVSNTYFAPLAPGFMFTEQPATPAIRVSQNNVLVPAGASTSIANGTNFGNAMLGVPTTRTYTIQNSGFGNLSISSINNTNATDFAVSGVTTPLTLTPGQTANLQVTFNSSTLGIKNSTITINTNDPISPRNAYVLQLQAEAIPTVSTTNNALQFANGQRVETPNASALIANKSAFALETWVNLYNPAPNVPDLDGIVGFRNDTDCDFYILHRTSNTIEGRFRNSAGTSVNIEATIPSLLWNHIALVYTGTELQMYINGALRASSAATGQITNTTESLLTGLTAGIFGEFFLSGAVDEVRLWDTNVTEAQINQNMHTPLAGTETGLVIYYDFNQGIIGGNNMGVNTLLDRAGTPQNANLINFALSGSGTTATNWVAGFPQAINLPTINRGNAIRLNGGASEQRVRLNNIGSVYDSNDLTFEAWVKPDWASGDFAGNDPALFSSRAGSTTRLSVHMGNGLQHIGIWNGIVYRTVPFTFVRNVWYHVAIVEYANNTEIFVNGRSIGFSGNSINTANTSLGYTIGSATIVNEFFAGEMEEVRIWRTARSAAQIRENMHITLKQANTHLLAYIPFSEAGTPTNYGYYTNAPILQGVSAPTIIPSTVDIANGFSSRQTLSGTGLKTFGNNTNISFTFSTAPGTGDEFVAYRLEATPIAPVAGINQPSNYWIVRNFGLQTYTYSDVSVTLPAGDNIADEATPNNIKLFRRSTNSNNANEYVAAGSATAANNTTKVITFGGMNQSSFEHFAIASRFLTVPTTSLSSFNALVTTPSASQAFTISGTGLGANASVSLSSGDWELSIDNSAWSSSNITLTQTSGSLVGQPVTIYVRLKSGLSLGNKTANINITSTGATTRTITLAGLVCPNVSIIPVSLPSGSKGVVYDQTFAQTGLTGTATWTTTVLPTGLTINPVSGRLSGTPSVVGTFSIDITVGNGTCSFTQNYTLVITNPPFILFTTNKPEVSTFVGNNSGFSNGTGTDALLNNPVGIGVDENENLFVADQANHSIRKITSEAVVTTLAGNGTSGGANGTGAGARFNNPTGVVVDATGNAYVADRDNHRIRRITPAGVVTHFAGSGTAGNANGTGTAAQFNNPSDITIDVAGNLYVADRDNHKIRKITPAGVVTNFAGDGTAGLVNATGVAARLNTPVGLAIDVSDNIYVVDQANHAIRRITPAGVVTTLAGDGTAGFADGTGAAAKFSSPTGLSVDGVGNIYVADRGNNRIRRITPAGVVTTLTGLATAGNTDGAANSATFNSPSGIGVDRLGNIYISDFANHRIRKFAYKLNNFSSTQGTASVAQSFEVSGVNIASGIDIEAPPGYELSFNPTANYFPFVVVNATAGVVPTTTIYIRLASTAPLGQNDGNITLEASGAPIQIISVKGIVCPANIDFTPAVLPIAVQGVAYNQIIAQTTLTGTLTWSVSAGSLPTGITINPTTGAITGTPTVINNFNFTLQVTNGECTASKVYSIAVVCPTGTNSISPISLPSAVQGVPYTQTLTQTGLVGTITWSVSTGSLPAGLTLSASTGVISGTANNIATSTFTITASNGSCSTVRIYNITVACPVATLTPTTLPQATQGVTYTQTFTQTGIVGTITWSVIAGALPAGLTLNVDTGILSGTPTLASISNFTLRATNGSCSAVASYALVVNCPTNVVISPANLPNGILGSAYTANLAQTNLSGILTWEVALGNLPDGLTLNSVTGVISGTPTLVSTFNFTIKVSNNSCSSTRIYSITINCPVLNIGPATLASAAQGVFYTQDLTQTGFIGTVTWAVVSGDLPTGLLLNTATGVISGSPTTVNTFNFTIQATGSGCSATRAFAIVVGCPTNSTPLITLTQAVQGIPYSRTLTSSGLIGTPNWSVVSGVLPTGLVLNSLTGIISGTPVVVNTYDFRIQVNNGSCTVTQDYRIVVVCASNLSISPATIPNGTQGSLYVQSLSQIGLVGVVTWSVDSGTLPTGITLNPVTGELNGIPIVAATYNFTIKAKQNVCETTRSYTISITCASVININPPLLTPAVLGQSYNQSLSQIGLPDLAPNWSVTVGSLPTGLSLDAITGVISGVPTTLGIANFTIRVAEGNCSQTRNYDLLVGINPPTAIAPTSLTSNSFTANWQALPSAISYRLDVSGDNFNTFLAGYENIVVNATSTNVTGLLPNIPYQYRVRAVDVNGTSGNSNIISLFTLLTTPVATNATAITSSSFIANWSTISGATSYRLDVSTDNFTTFVTGYNDLVVNTNSQLVTGLNQSTTYQYRVRAVNNNSTSFSSNTVVASTLLNALTALPASNITNNSFIANWNNVAGVDSYRLDVSNDGFATFVVGFNNLTVATNSQIVTGLNPNTTYQYRVRAVNANGTTANSNIIEVITTPVPPIAREANTVTQSSFNATWSSVLGAISYRLDVSTESNFNTFVTGYNNLIVNTLTFSVTGLNNGVTYYYRVRSVSPGGIVSPSSNVITVRVLYNPPTNLQVRNSTPPSSTRLVLAWTDNATGEQGFKVERATAPNAPFVEIATINTPNTTTYTDETVNLLANPRYLYRVRAFNGTLFSPYSNVAIYDLATAQEMPTTNNNVKVYPNPSQDVLFLDLDQNWNRAKITIQNAWGVVVFETQNDNQSKLRIDLSHLPTGTYFLRTEQNKQVNVQKITKF